MVEKYEEREYKTYEKYGNLSDVKLGIQAGLMWLYCYTPGEGEIPLPSDERFMHDWLV